MDATSASEKRKHGAATSGATPVIERIAEVVVVIGLFAMLPIILAL